MISGWQWLEICPADFFFDHRDHRSLHSLDRRHRSARDGDVMRYHLGMFGVIRMGGDTLPTINTRFVR